MKKNKKNKNKENEEEEEKDEKEEEEREEYIDGIVWEFTCNRNDGSKNVPEKMCTCCHRVCKDLKRLNMKDYDLNYYIVQKCLSPKNRLTHNGIAYICKTCHMN